jgi:prophage regulatory protein
MLNTIFRLPNVIEQSGLSRSSVYLRISQGLWTKPISLGGRAVGWPANEVNELIAARIAGRNDEEIRDLVTNLETNRKSAL